MKKHFKFSVYTKQFLIFLFLIVGVKGYGQATYVPATYPESFLISGAQNDINTAMIDYTPNCTWVGGCGKAQLSVTAWDDATTSIGYLIVADGVGNTITKQLP